MDSIFGQKGFSLPEVLVGVGVLGIVTVGAITLSRNSAHSVKGTRSINDLNTIMMEIRKTMNNPDACRKNFKDKAAGSTLQQIVGVNGDTLYKVTPHQEAGTEYHRQPTQPTQSAAGKVGSGAYSLTNVTVDSLDTLRKHARIRYDFKKNQKEAGSQTISKYMNILVDVSGTKINDCIDPVQTMSDGALRKLCWDADPLNYDGTASNNNTDCEDNLANVVAEAKALYCSSIAFLDYDPSTGKCRPLDANLTCPNKQYLKGYAANGSKKCFKLSTVPVSSPSPGPSSSPSPSPSASPNPSASPSPSLSPSPSPSASSNLCWDTGADTCAITGQSCDTAGQRVSTVCDVPNQPGQSTRGTAICGLCYDSPPYSWHLAGTCFIAGTPVTMADGSLKPIEEVSKNDQVLSFDESTRQFVSSPVVAKIVHHKKVQNIYSLQLANGREVSSSGSHPIFVLEKNDYLDVSEIYQRWMKGEKVTLWGQLGEPVTLLYVLVSKEEIGLYNLHVRSSYDSKESESLVGHNYFANGVLVHNKAVDEDMRPTMQVAMDCCISSGGTITTQNRLNDTCNGTQAQELTYNACFMNACPGYNAILGTCGN